MSSAARLDLDDQEINLPNSPEIEQGVLGSILLKNDHFAEIVEIVRDVDFYLGAHRVIYRAMTDIISGGKNCDIVTLTNFLREHRELGVAGGVSRIATMTDQAPHATKHVIEYAQKVRALSRRRQLIESLMNATREACDLAQPLDQCVATVERGVVEVLAEHTRGEAQLVADFAMEAGQELFKLRERNKEIIGMPTGISELDQITSGLRDGEVTVIAAWPGGGKSALACQIANNVATVSQADYDFDQKQRVGVAYFSIEMRKQQLLYRNVTQDFKVSMFKIRNPINLSDVDFESVHASLKRLSRLPYWIDDTARLEIDQMIARARMLHAKGARLFVFDYVQRIHCDSERELRLKVNKISARITEFAKVLQVPCLVLSQLSKPDKKASNPRPHAGLLKESGNLWEDAHNVWLLYRPVGDDGEYTGNDEIIIDKQRDGTIGKVTTRLDGSFQTWKYRAPEQKPKAEAKSVKRSGAKGKERAVPDEPEPEQGELPVD